MAGSTSGLAPCTVLRGCVPVRHAARGAPPTPAHTCAVPGSGRRLPQTPHRLLPFSVLRWSGVEEDGRLLAVWQESCSVPFPKPVWETVLGAALAPSSSAGRGRWAQQDPREREDCGSSGTGSKPVSNDFVHPSASESLWDRARVPQTVTPRLPAFGTTGGERLGLGAGVCFAPAAGAWPAPCEQAGNANRSSELLLQPCLPPACARIPALGSHYQGI